MLYDLGVRLFFGLGSVPLPLDYSPYISFCLGPCLILTDRDFRLRLDPPRLDLAIFL